MVSPKDEGSIVPLMDLNFRFGTQEFKVHLSLFIFYMSLLTCNSCDSWFFQSLFRFKSRFYFFLGEHE